LRNRGRLSLLWAIAIAPLRGSYGRTLVAVSAIALGVALGVAIHLINRSAADEVSSAARRLFGQADLTVRGGSAGFDEQIYPRIARMAGVRTASPVVEVDARLLGRSERLKLLGIDAFRASQMQPAFASVPRARLGGAGDEGVYLSESAARNLGMRPGDMLRVQVGLQAVVLRIIDTLPASAFPQSVGILDIATAQWKLQRLGVLDRVDVQAAGGADVSRLRAAIAAILPAGVHAGTAQSQTDEALRFSRAYRGNLTALALVALFTGGFLVYATQSAAVMRRRRDLALWHALGATRTEQIGALLFGSGLIGVVGSGVGVLLGIGAADFALHRPGIDLGAGYFRDATMTLGIHPVDMGLFFALGVAVTLLATVRPVAEAARIPTAAALKSADVDVEVAGGHVYLGIAMLLLACLFLFLPAIAGLPLPGYAAIALILVGVVLLMPSFTRLLLRRLRAPRSPPAFIALSHLRGTARYAVLSVAAILVSFALMVAMAIMVNSFRLSLDHWLQRLLPADLYLRAGSAQQSAFFGAADLEKLRGFPGIARLEANRFATVQLPAGGPEITVIARPIDEENAARVLWLTHATGLIGDTGLSGKGNGIRPTSAVPVWISEQLADRLNLGPGSRLVLPLGAQPVACYVSGLWRDYERQNGSVVMNRETYARLTGDKRANTIWMWLRPGYDINSMAAEVRKALPADAEYDLRLPAEIRALSLRTFDRTFAITYLIEVIAVLIGLMGVSSSMSTQVLARRAELGALRHVGMTRRQIAAMLAFEGAGLGALGVIAGLITGTVLSFVLIYVVNRQSFHWSMDLHIPVATLLLLAVGLVVAAALTALWSGRRAMQTDVVLAVKEDW
jgi:putative ABC transport system permease protein